MSEQPTTMTPNNENTQDPLQDALDMQSAAAARRLAALDIEAEQPEAKKPSFAGSKLHRSIGVLAAGATIVAGAAIVDNLSGAEFSDETRERVVESGDGLERIAEDILGSDTIDIRDATHHIQQDPANIDVLKDGLQPGEVIIIPDRVEGYEEPEE